MALLYMAIVLWLLFRYICALQCIGLISEQTPSEITQAIQQSEIPVRTIYRESFDEVLIFDFLYNRQKSLALREELECSACIINGNPYWLESATLIPSLEDEYAAIAALLKILSISEVLLICGPTENVLFRGNGIISTTLEISEEISSHALELLARRVIKAQSLRALVLCVEGELALRLLQVLQASRLDYPITILLAQKTSWFDKSLTPTLPGGILFLTSQGCELAGSFTDTVACRIRQRITGALENSSFTVLQLQTDSSELVGLVYQGHASLCLECLRRIPVSPIITKVATLQFSFNNGIINPSGVILPEEAQYYWGADLAVADINQSTELLPFSELLIFNVSLGLFEFNAEWARQQLAQVTPADLGLAFLHGHYSNVAIPLYSFLTSFNFTRPQIAADNSSPLLSAASFPHYARVTISSAYTGVMYARFIKHYGWTRFSLLYCDDLYCTQLAKTLEQAATEYGLEIVVNASNRMLPTNMTSYPYDYLHVLQELVDSKVRIVVLAMYGKTLTYCIEALYDLGMRRGDLLFLPVMWLVPQLFDDAAEDVYKRKELLSGALQIYPGAFLGSVGRDIQARFQKVYGMEPAHFACTNYDAVLLLAHCLDYLRARGLAYEDTNVLSQELRKARFIGCTGDVSLQEGERLPAVFDITNVVVEESGKVAIFKVGFFKPLSTVLLSFSRNVTWPDGTSLVPGDTRVNLLDCPFEPKEMREYWPAKALEAGSFMLFGLFGLLVTVLIWRKFWRRGALVMQGRAEISLEDYLLYAAIGVEGVQYCYLGPTLQEWCFEAQRFLVFVDWDLRRLFVHSRKLLIISVAISLGAVGLWISLLLAAALRLRCTLAQLGYYLLPQLGNVCFVPILASLLSLLQCGQAASAQDSPRLADTYVLEDCYLRCWGGLHLGLIIPGLLALVAYLPSAVYLRPKWQEVQQTLHIPVSPTHLMIKSVYQLLTVINHKELGYPCPLAHVIVFFLLTICYFSASILWPPYGYGRANLWHIVSLSCALWYSLIMSISTYVDTKELVWVSVLISGLGLIVAGALLLQCLCFPSQLYRKKGIAIVDLFRFQFSKEPQAHNLFAKKAPIATVSPADVQICVTTSKMLG